MSVTTDNNDDNNNNNNNIIIIIIIITQLSLHFIFSTHLTKDFTKYGIKLSFKLCNTTAVCLNY